jgi:hypothetical protein
MKNSQFNKIEQNSAWLGLIVNQGHAVSTVKNSSHVNFIDFVNESALTLWR